MKRRLLARIGVGAAFCLTSGMLMVGSGGAAHAVGPGGCVAQGANGAVAAGSLTDGDITQQPSPPAAGTCTYVQPAGTGGGVGGGDSAGWSVTMNMAPGAATPPGTDCVWTKGGTSTAPTWTTSGSGQAACGFGSIPGGANVTVVAN